MIVSLDPFPHVIEDGLWSVGALVKVRDSFPPPDSPVWRRFDNGHERKLASLGTVAAWPHPVQEFIGTLTSPQWCRKLGDLFGIDDLTADTYGGGMHMIPPGGKLDIHVDFNVHPNGLYRRLNCLIYLNDWDPADGGELELRQDEHTPLLKVAPVFNRTVIFATSDRSWHGHPTPTGEGFWRKSIAVYYYSPEPSPGFRSPHDTIFEAN